MIPRKIRQLAEDVARWFNALRVRNKLFMLYSILFSLIVLLSGIVLYALVSLSIERQIERELNNSTATVLNMVRTVARISIRVHLESIMRENLRYVEQCREQSIAGLITEREARALAGARLLQQKIGKTGYIFVWDIGEAPRRIPLAVHPVIQGQDVAYVDFVQKGAALKNGYMEYEWANPGEKEKRKKSMYLHYFEPWKWVIAASSYKEEFLDLVRVDDFRSAISTMHFGKSGYSFVIDMEGNVVIHPRLKGNFRDAKDAEGFHFIREILRKKEGKIVYTWKNPGEKVARKKLCVYHHLPENNWIVASTGYYDDFQKPMVFVRNIMVVSFLVTIMLVLTVTYWASEKITGPLREITDGLSHRQRGDFTARMNVESGDEIGSLATYFNGFMADLEKYSADLRGEISEREKAEDQLRASLKEKEILLRELYHRTKNNMQVICSMLSLESSRQGNEALGPVLTEIELKIRTMAMVHQNLLESSDLSRIDLVDYFRQVARLIIDNGVPHDGPVTAEVTGAPVPISIDTAIPLGLVLNELISNSVKHAFNASDRGAITVTVTAGEGTIVIVYGDSGPGLPAGGAAGSGSLGMMLMTQIIKHQLRGSIEVSGPPGFNCVITVAREIAMKMT